MYLQIVEQTGHALEVGVLRPGDRMPTVRQLARELGVAPNTVIKAYDELRRRGLIETRIGAGTVVAGDVEANVRARQVDALHERLRAVARDGLGLGIDAEELKARFAEEIGRLSGEAGRRGEAS
jgi:GntR family transcriptional regulator